VFFYALSYLVFFDSPIKTFYNNKFYFEDFLIFKRNPYHSACIDPFPQRFLLRNKGYPISYLLTLTCSGNHLQLKFAFSGILFYKYL